MSRDIDILIATKILGCKDITRWKDGAISARFPCGEFTEIGYYFDNDSDALVILEHYREKQKAWRIETTSCYGKFIVSNYDIEERPLIGWDWADENCHTEASKLSHAICYAVLMSVSVELSEEMQQ